MRRSVSAAFFLDAGEKMLYNERGGGKVRRQPTTERKGLLQMANTENEKKDIFDRIMSQSFLKRFEPIYTKHKEVLLYLFFGGLTTVISWIFFAIPIKLLGLPDIEIMGFAIDANSQVANVISWICAVTFAYVTNRIWVFTDKARGRGAIAAECVKFFAGRIVTLIIENILINIFTRSIGTGEMTAKIAVSIVTVILNYVISKLFVFKKSLAESEK